LADGRFSDISCAGKDNTHHLSCHPCEAVGRFDTMESYD
jgi:hypothetical protein